ncbi:unnamed protein product [Closterium sp. NIES-53]
MVNKDVASGEHAFTMPRCHTFSQQFSFAEKTPPSINAGSAITGYAFTAPSAAWDGAESFGSRECGDKMEADLNGTEHFGEVDLHVSAFSFVQETSESASDVHRKQQQQQQCQRQEHQHPSLVVATEATGNALLSVQSAASTASPCGMPESSPRGMPESSPRGMPEKHLPARSSSNTYHDHPSENFRFSPSSFSSRSMTYPPSPHFWVLSAHSPISAQPPSRFLHSPASARSPVSPRSSPSSHPCHKHAESLSLQSHPRLVSTQDSPMSAHSALSALSALPPPSGPSSHPRHRRSCSLSLRPDACLKSTQLSPALAPSAPSALSPLSSHHPRHTRVGSLSLRSSYAPCSPLSSSPSASAATSPASEPDWSESGAAGAYIWSSITGQKQQRDQQPHRNQLQQQQQQQQQKRGKETESQDDDAADDSDDDFVGLYGAVLRSRTPSATGASATTTCAAT